jgi:PAS domain S-box-containing protein
MSKDPERLHPTKEDAAASIPAESPDYNADLKDVLQILRAKVGHDFRRYEPNMIVRSIRRRMTLAKAETFAAYSDFLREHAEEAVLLQKDLLIGVTDFFQQPQALDILEMGIDITERKKAEEALRESEQRVRLKLESILSPEGDLGNLDLSDMIDTRAIQSLMDDFHKLVPIPMSIVDLNGKVLVGVGWQAICTRFHRTHPETRRHCLERDTQLSAGLLQGESKLYRCKNSMWEIATPIMVGGQHVGNVFSGQFFFDDEPLDYEFFRSQAQRYGFDEEKYILALEAVPRLSRESVDTSMAFFMKFADLLSKLSYSNIKLARSLTQQDTLMHSLQQSEEDLNFAQAVARTGSWRLDVRLNRLAWSDEAHRIFGISKGTPLTYEAFLDTVHPDDRDYVDREWAAALGGDPYDIEHRIVVGDKVKWVRERAELEFDASGSLLGGFGTVQDITERKRVEAALLESEARSRLLSSTASALLVADNPQEIVNELCREVMAHLGCQTFFNFLVDEQTGKLHLNAWAGIPEDEASKIEWLEFGEAVCGCADRDKVRIVAEDISYTDDPRTDLVKPYGIQAYACHPLMVQGRLIGTLSFGTKTRTCFSEQDLALMKTVTDQVATAMERMRLIEELQESRDQLELRVQERTAELVRRNKELQEFVFVASHDLREPLRKIQTFGDLAVMKSNKGLTDAGRDCVSRMQTGAARMQTLLESLLRYSRVTNHAEPFQETDLNKSVETALSNLDVVVGARKARLEIGQLPTVEADRVQMVQLFQNLISNALKFQSPNNTPRIKIYSMAVEGRFRKNNAYEICVEDNGIGFDEQYLDKIFKPFQRLHGRDEYPGVGIGLAICRKIAERHRGSLTASSTPGKGATFVFTLPGKQLTLRRGITRESTHRKPQAPSSPS